MRRHLQWWAGPGGSFDEEGRNEGVLAGAGYHAVNFASSFSAVPHVFATLATFGGADPANIRSLGWTSAQLKIFVAEDTCDGEVGHANENAHVLAVHAAATAVAQHENDCALSCALDWVSDEGDLLPPVLVSGCTPVTLEMDPGQNFATLVSLGSGCPPDFPHPSPPHANIICYNAESYATAGGGPCGSWCTLDVAVGSGCGSNQNRMCAQTSAAWVATAAADPAAPAGFTQMLSGHGLSWGSDGLFGDEYNDIYSLQECAQACSDVPGALGFQYGENNREGDCICAQGLGAVGGSNANWKIYELVPNALRQPVFSDARYTLKPNLQCGAPCSPEISLFIGANGERWSSSTRADVSLCEEICGASAECSGFNWANNKCYYRGGFGTAHDITCHQESNTARDCYVKKDSTPNEDLGYHVEMMDAGGNWADIASTSTFQPAGPTQIRWTVTDAVGNAGSCETSVAVVDNEAPELQQSNCVPMAAPGTASAPTEYDAATLATMAFDGDLSTLWDGCCGNYPHQQIEYALASAHIVSGYRFATAEGECPVAWTMEASTDGTSFVAVDSQDAQACHDGTFVTYHIAPAAFQHFRWSFSAGVGGNSNGIRLREIELLNCDSTCGPVAGATDAGQSYATASFGAGTGSGSGLHLSEPVFTDNSGEPLQYSLEVFDTASLGWVAASDPVQFPYTPAAVGTQIRWTATDTAGNAASCETTVTIADGEAPVLQPNTCGDVSGTTDPGKPYATPIMPGGGSDFGLVLPEPVFTDNSGEPLQYSLEVHDPTTGGWVPAPDPSGEQYILWDDNDNPNDDLAGIANIDDLNAACESLGGRPVQVHSADQVHNILRPLLVDAGYDLSRGSGVPLGYDYNGDNTYQSLDTQIGASESVTEIFQELHSSYGYTGDYTTNQMGDNQRLAGFGWANGGDNVGVEDWGFHHPMQALICSIQQLQFPYASGTQVQWTAADPSGNAASCSLVVTVTDDEAPTLASGCGDETGTTDAGKPYGTVGAGSLALPQPTFDDNSGETLTYEMHMGTALVDTATSEFAYMLSAASPISDLGQSHDTAADGSSVMITTVVWTATDKSGKSSTCSLKVTITDDEAPTLASGCGD